MSHASPTPIDLDGHQVRVRINKRAKRISIRIDGRGPVLVLPRASLLRQGHAFVRERKDWIIANATPTILRTDSIGIWTYEKHRSGLSIEIDQINQTIWHNIEKSQASAMSLMRKFATAELEPLVQKEADAQSVTNLLKKVSIHNFRGKWGSCDSVGHIKLCAKLSFVEQDLRDYVISHEVAHLSEQNHSQKFWQLVESRQPHHKTHRKALKKQHPEIILDDTL